MIDKTVPLKIEIIDIMLLGNSNARAVYLGRCKTIYGKIVAEVVLVSSWLMYILL